MESGNSWEQYYNIISYEGHSQSNKMRPKLSLNNHYTVNYRETCICEFTEQHSHRVASPWTAMVFLSCRMEFPTDTCTVTVLMPSRGNVHDTLPSRVITGCWGRERERHRGGRGR